MHLLYIDPGTGSMLFAILIGIIGVVTYLLKSWFVKLRFILSGGKTKETISETIPIAIFADDKRYWPIFEGVCREFDKRGIDVVYLTASEDDPALNNPYEHIRGEFIGEGNHAFARLNFLNATIVLSTTPGLDVLQWKRSKNVKYYVHILHAPCEVTLYRMFGLDYYDAILVSGEYQIRDTRKLEEIRHLPAKELELIGIPYMDEMARRFKESPECPPHERTVLVAPSWGESGILSKYGSGFINKLLETGYHIIIRPHPQSFKSEKELMDKLMKEFPDSDRIEWNRDNDNFEVLKRSDILISDFSGVVFDFSLIYDKPIIYADTDFDKSPYDAWWLDELWTFTALPRLGKCLKQENMDNVKEMIDEVIDSPEFAQSREEVRNETWVHIGEGSVRTVDFIERKYKELTENAEVKEEKVS